MNTTLLTVALIILLCIIAYRFSDKFGMPVLLLFMGLGMFFGADGPIGIYFNNYQLTEQICTICLAFIMFYGGFGTNWKSAKPIAVKAITLSTLGVVATALLTAAFCYYAFNYTFAESFLIGAVLSSTDAASVFSILRSKNLALKDKTAPLLEVESGSNDPSSYMLTIIAISIINKGDVSIGLMVFSQLFFAIIFGVLIALIARMTIGKISELGNGMDTIFMFAVVLISYALPGVFGGNGFLSVYITGIILGNSKIKNKVSLVHFYDGINGLSQILVFFLLGLLSFPSRIPSIMITSVGIAVFLALVARPITIFALLTPFKSSLKQKLIVSWAGLRGAASIVFAIMALSAGVGINGDLFHIVFVVSLLSVAFQGALLPRFSKKLDMIDYEDDILKTFNDYHDESSLALIRMFIPEEHHWQNKKISEIQLPADSLAVMINRGDETIIPKGDTVVLAQDSLILSIPTYTSEDDLSLKEIEIDKSSPWCNRTIEELDLPKNILIAMIKRGDENIIPRGHTILLEKDIIVMIS